MQVRAYVERRNTIDGVDLNTENVLSVFEGRNEPLMRKPLFVARAYDMLAEGRQLSQERDLLEQLIESYVQREQQEKLLDRQGRPVLSEQQVTSLLEMIAEEMWHLEVRELDSRSIREIAEYYCEIESLGDAHRDLVTQRLPSFAGLTTSSGTTNAKIGFEHELFFFFFVARIFHDAVQGHIPRLINLLRKGGFDAAIGERVARTFLQQARNADSVLKALGEASESSGQDVSDNAGALAIEVLKHYHVEGHDIERLEIRHLSFAGSDFNELELTDCSFDAVQFRRCTLTRASFRNCSANDVVLIEVLVDPAETRLELHGLDMNMVYGLRETTADGIKTVFEPNRVREILTEIGTLDTQGIETVSRNIDSEVVSLVDHLMRAYRRANPVCTEDEHLSSLFQHPQWPDVQRLLTKSGVVTSETKPASGSAKEFLRRQFTPDEILAGLNPVLSVPREVDEFWNELQRDYPAD